MNNFDENTNVYVERDLMIEFKIRGTPAILFSLFTGNPYTDEFGFSGKFSELMRLTNCSKQGVKDALKKLEAKGLIRIRKPEKLTDLEAFQKLNKKNSRTGCLFCGFDEFEPLDKHHYPIRRKDGGKETIRLCPNCHRHFHILTGDVDTDLIIDVLKQDEIIRIRNSWRNQEQGEN